VSIRAPAFATVDAVPDHDRNRNLARATDESVWVRHGARLASSDDDPTMHRQLRVGASRAKPIHWARWLLFGIVAGATVAGVVTFALTGDDDQALGRVLVAALPGAFVGWLVVAALAALGAFRRTDELGD